MHADFVRLRIWTREVLMQLDRRQFIRRTSRLRIGDILNFTALPLRTRCRNYRNRGGREIAGAISNQSKLVFRYFALA